MFLIERMGRVLMLLLGCNLVLISTAGADNKNESQCSASSEYLIELTRLGLSSNIETDYSCLTDLPSLLPRLPSFQLVNTQQSPINHTSLKDAWLMPISDLKNKSFLQNKPLLLIDKGFSRVSAARDCAELKKQGFTSIKILLGGIDTWIGFKRAKNDPPRNQTIISSQEVLFEYFNGQVVLISTSTEVSKKLKAFGITKFHDVDIKNKQAIVDIALTQSNNGYDPVVIVSEKGEFNFNFPLNLPNLYQLSGGIYALKKQIEQNAWANHNRTAPMEGGACAAR